MNFKIVDTTGKGDTLPGLCEAQRPLHLLHVKGHSGCTGNERADALAAQGQTETLHQGHTKQAMYPIGIFFFAARVRGVFPVIVGTIWQVGCIVLEVTLEFEVCTFDLKYVLL